MITDRPDHIWAIEAVATAAEIILEVVVEVEGLAVLQTQHAIQTPAILQALPVAAHFREVIAEVPSKTARDVEIGWAILELRVGAVIGLRGIRHEIFTVAGVVKRLRIREIHNRSNAMPSSNAVTGLQRVVIGLASRVLVQSVEGAVGVPTVISRYPVAGNAAGTASGIAGA